MTTISSIYSSTPSNIFESAIQLIANGFVAEDIATLLDAYSLECSSDSNVNSREPSETVYPQKSPEDAPYSLSESALRQAIHIPSTFTYGEKPPVIMLPGTGTTGCITFRYNYIKLFQDVDYADPVWLNIPHFLLDDVQVNAEYAAYAINYISAISGNRNVSVLGWSQGNLDAQWAFKYWPSTRSVVSDFINISPDYHGTVEAYLICPGFPTVACVPAAIQQAYESNFISTLRSDGGDSAYVPTTSIYSATDDIVQPQTGLLASGRINDARGVGVTNNEVQVVCLGRPAGLLYTHPGVLFNPLAYALAVDALTHDGPGQPSRIDLNTVCNQIASPGLSVADVVASEGTVAVAAAAIALYVPKVGAEPPIMAYAL